MSEQDDDSMDGTFGVINGVFIRKVPMTVVVYPEIVDQIKQRIRALEHVSLQETLDIHKPYQ